MMEKSQHHIGKQLAYICKVCGKEARQGNMKHHIETNHLEGVVIPCNLCDRTFKSRNALGLHDMRQQKGNLLIAELVLLPELIWYPTINVK